MIKSFANPQKMSPKNKGYVNPFSRTLGGAALWSTLSEISSVNKERLSKKVRKN